MKNILILLSIALLSTVINAEDALTPAIEAGKEVIANIVKTDSNAQIKVETVQNNANNSSLWEILDTNKDNAISKTEAVVSKDVSDNWETLDSNKDKQLDTEEFAKIFSLEN